MFIKDVTGFSYSIGVVVLAIVILYSEYKRRKKNV